MVRFATDAEITSWDLLIAANPDGGEVWQTREYAEQKARWHYNVHYLIAQSDTGADIAVTVHEKKVPLTGRLWYLPKGPGVTSLEELATVSGSIAEFGRTHGVFALKVEPPLTYLPAGPVPESFEAITQARQQQNGWLREHGFRESTPIIPNASTIVVDITGDDDDVFRRLPNKKLRGIIRRTEREGVVVRAVEATDENCAIFYSLFEQTADGRFGIRPKQYYLDFWKRFAAAGLGQIMFAYANNRVIAAEYITTFGGVCTSKDAGSLRQLPVYGATQLLRWKSIEWARTRGCTSYDMCGSPSSDHIKDESDPFYGIGRFKIAFSRIVLDYIGAWDYPIDAMKYRFFVGFTERLARRLSLIVRKDPYY